MAVFTDDLSTKDRLVHAWNAFLNRKPEDGAQIFGGGGATYGSRPDRVRLHVSNERSIISSIYMRLAIDIANVDLRHVRLDLKKNKRYVEDIASGLNNCLELEANIDQNAQHFMIDLAMNLFDQGTIAVVAVDTTLNPDVSGGYDVQTLRVGSIVGWMPKHVRVNLYNEETGRREEVVLAKKNVAIVENPLYSVMNEPNSTLQRLIRKLNLLDSIDEQSASGKLDMIIQLPYTIRSESRRAQAEQRRKDIEFQLKGSQYGIAYTDGTEKITQLNRPAENNLMSQITYLTEMLYGQLGLTPEVMLGTADEAAMLNYNNRTIMPILTAIALEMKRKFLTKTARTQGQSIEYFRDPFKLVPMKDLAEMVDKFTRNEVFSSNEIRGYMGVKPSDDPKADELRNSNMPQPADPSAAAPADESAPADDTAQIMNDAFDEIDSQLDEAFAGIDTGEVDDGGDGTPSNASENG